jgi:hypothetical protein
MHRHNLVVLCVKFSKFLVVWVSSDSLEVRNLEHVKNINCLQASFVKIKSETFSLSENVYRAIEHFRLSQY